MRKILFLIAIGLNVFLLQAQEVGVITGKIIDAKSRESIPFVNVVVLGTTIGASSNENGEFKIDKVPLGYARIQASFLGYSTVISSDYLVTKEKSPFILLELSEDKESLDEVVVRSRLIQKSIESPLSKQSLGIAEIEKNPGGNRDILKVIQSFPGVASSPSFRNDIVIRGGAPSENKFYLDGVEIPVINHFQTQGTTGGPVGIINADLIRKADFYASAFKASEGNTLSSIIEFTQKDGNSEKINSRVTLGTSDAGVTFDGPIGENTNFIVSARQSYLQFLFKLIKLPFLPTYNDFQFKVKHKISEKDEISVIGIGVIDNFELNESVNDNINDEDVLKRNEYALSNIPISEQWNYTVGAVYKHYAQNSMQQYVLSRSEWNNSSVKYFNNTGNLDDLLLKYESDEIENKFRFENTSSSKTGYKINFGFGLENVVYKNSTFQKIANSNGVLNYDFNSTLKFNKYGLFGQVSKSYFNSLLNVSVGFRVDGNSYNREMKNPFDQFSPRIALSYKLDENISFNATTGKYFQLPAYTIMGYRNNDNELVNKENGLEFINATHYVAGIEYKPGETSKVTLEGFYKKYKNYPFSVENGISLANLGSDFGVVGNEEVNSNSEGKAYGFEVFAQKRSYSGLYGIASYTYVISEFKNEGANFIPSSWDNKHLLTLTGGKKLNKNWEIGGKFRLIDGQPYTPYDTDASSLISNYNVSNSGILDFSKLNSERFKTFNQLDVRVDKTWYWDSLSLNFYIDIQNLYASKYTTQAYLIPILDENGNRSINSNDSSRYNLEEIENESGNILPSFGIIIDF